MSKVGDSILRGLTQAIDIAKGKADPKTYRVHIPEKVDVKAIRKGLGLTQEGFAGRYGFSINAVRHWEQGTRKPESGTRAYLLVIENSPEVVAEAIQRTYTES